MEIPNIPFEVPACEGLKWGVDPGWIYEEKIDGVRAILEFGKLRGRAKEYPLPGPLPESLHDCVLDGELKDGTFHVFDVVVWGHEISTRPLAYRLSVLDSIAPLFPAWIARVRSAQDGGNLLREVLSAGGEGIVKKSLSARWGKMWIKCKRSVTHDCVITVLHPQAQSATVRQGKLDCGKVFLGNQFCKASIGSVIEVTAHSRHNSGKFREAHFLRFREDKPASAC